MTWPCAEVFQPNPAVHLDRLRAFQKKMYFLKFLPLVILFNSTTIIVRPSSTIFSIVHEYSHRDDNSIVVEIITARDKYYMLLPLRYCANGCTAYLPFDARPRAINGAKYFNLRHFGYSRQFLEEHGPLRHEIMSPVNPGESMYMDHVGSAHGPSRLCFEKNICKPRHIKTWNFAIVGICCVGIFTNVFEIATFAGPKLRSGNGILFAFSGLWDVGKLCCQLFRHIDLLSREAPSTGYSARRYGDYAAEQLAYAHPQAGMCVSGEIPTFDRCFERSFDILAAYNAMLISPRVCLSITKVWAYPGRTFMVIFIVITATAAVTYGMFPRVAYDNFRNTTHRNRVPKFDLETHKWLCVVDLATYYVVAYALPCVSILLINGITLQKLLRRPVAHQHADLNTRSHISAAKIISAISICFLIFEVIPQWYIVTQLLYPWRGRRSANERCTLHLARSRIDTNFEIASTRSKVIQVILETSTCLTLLNCICLDQLIYFAFSREYRRRLQSLFRMPWRKNRSCPLASSGRVPPKVKATYTTINGSERVALDVQPESTIEPFMESENLAEHSESEPDVKQLQ